MTKETKVRRLFADIETSLMHVYAFSAGYNLNINHDAIIKERKIICIAYKWEGERNVTVLRWDSKQDDKEMLAEFVKVANEADEIVGHYGNHFDWPWIRTRIMFHKLPPIPIWKTVDTKAIASKYFYFNSNKLDYISSFLGHGKKLRTEFSLWVKVDQGCRKALDYMCKYCGVDVKRLEAVFHDMQPYVPTKTHAGVKAGLGKWTCPVTGSTNVKLSKKRVTATGNIQYQMQNLETGSYYSISPTAYNDYNEHKKKKRLQAL
jgi:hypothetical protein